MSEHHERYEDDLAAFALGALDEAEAAEFRRHLATCPACRAHLLWLQPALSALPASVEPQDPPPHLRDRVMTTVRAEAKAQRPERERSQRVAARPSVRTRGWLRPAAALAAAAAAGALVTGLLVNEANQPAPTTTPLEASAPELGQAAGTLVRQGDSATVHVRGLPPVGGGDVYQAWLRYGDVVEPSTVFTVDERGNGVVAIPAGIEGADELMITREPPGGSSRPTTDPLIRAALS